MRLCRDTCPRQVRRQVCYLTILSTVFLLVKRACFMTVIDRRAEYWAAVGSLVLLWAASSLYRVPRESTERLLFLPTTPRILNGAAPSKSQTKNSAAPTAPAPPHLNANSTPSTSRSLDHIFNSEAEALAALSQSTEHRTLQRQ